MKKTSITPLPASALAFCAALLFASNGIALEKDTLNAADVNFIKQEAAAGMAVVKTAGLGAQKTSREDIKAFAQMLVTDHTAANEQLAKLATSKGVETSTVIDPKDAETYQTLEKYSGTEFDKEFLAEIVRGHKKCVSNFEEASSEAKDVDLKMWVNKTLPMLKAHRDKAGELSGNPAADNTARNVRDRNASRLTPLDQGSSKNDTEITAQIRKEVVASDKMSINAQNVKIITLNGRVTLRGPVNSAEEKRLIGEIAARIVRSDNVVSELEVK